MVKTCEKWEKVERVGISGKMWRKVGKSDEKLEKVGESWNIKWGKVG